MSAAADDRICCRCDRPVTGPARETVHDSMSGARPSTWAHEDPRACRAARDGEDP
ncbi:hypothetical protein ACWCQL_12185 [Streptomyces sp. NPDC002073]|uniref:hypothetical protein n=1 Tax=Streptomyces sp. NBC_00239 TaxID=2903640 RepID=UPI002E2C0D77|nr:hypothetical protein [Streptomyces sp. NBC_00239]